VPPRQRKDEVFMTQTNPIASRLTVAAAGAIGAGGMVAAAADSHGGGGSHLGPVAMVCLAHGPALLALGLSSVRGRWLTAAAALLALGTLVFAGDLLARQYLGHRAFPFAAPIGGVGMIGGWIAVIVGGLVSRA
jgi:uncharacterized membrane protein YgdD (TMEM256/DUF423 family)